MSHRIVLIREGRIAQVGTPDEVYHRPESRFVAEFVGDANMLSCTVVGREGRDVRVKLDDTAHETVLPHYGEDRLDPGDAGLVAVRPEHLHLAPAEGTDIVGTLRASVLLGPVTVHEVALDEGPTLRVQASPSDDAKSGDRVGVEIYPRRGTVVQREESLIGTG